LIAAARTALVHDATRIRAIRLGERMSTMLCAGVRRFQVDSRARPRAVPAA
jgi:hypothetical protein